MFDSLFDSIKFFFIFTIIAIVVIIVIVAIVKGREHYKYTQRQKANEQRIFDNVRKIKEESKKWKKSHKLNFMNYLAEEYNDLKEASSKPFGAGWACETVIMGNERLYQKIK